MSGGDGRDNVVAFSHWSPWVNSISEAPKVAPSYRISIVITRFDELTIFPGQSHTRVIQPYPGGYEPAQHRRSERLRESLAEVAIPLGAAEPLPDGPARRNAGALEVAARGIDYALTGRC